jgi:hypothetical protein
MGDVINFTDRKKLVTPEEDVIDYCCPVCDCDVFKLDSIGFYCAGCGCYIELDSE